MRHRNFAPGGKWFQKYQLKYHSFFLPSLPLGKFYPLPPRQILPPGRSFAPPSPKKGRTSFKTLLTHHPPLNTSATALVCIVNQKCIDKSKDFSTKEMRLQVKRAFISYFFWPKNNKKAGRLGMKPYSTTNTGFHTRLNLLSLNQLPLFCYPFFFEEYFNPQVSIYHKDTSSHIFIDLLGYKSPESFMNLLPNLHIPPWEKNFKFLAVKLLENTFPSHFLS